MRPGGFRREPAAVWAARGDDQFRGAFRRGRPPIRPKRSTSTRASALICSRWASSFRRSRRASSSIRRLRLSRFRPRPRAHEPMVQAAHGLASKPNGGWRARAMIEQACMSEDGDARW